MSEPTAGLPIFDSVRRAIKHTENDLEHDIERGWTKITGHMHHASHQQATPTTKGTPMSSIVTDVKNAVEEGIDNIKGWAEDLETKLPALAEKAAKYENSPIVQALEAAVLPPGVEQEIANLIAKLGTLGGAASTTATASTDAGTAAVTSTPAPAAS